MPPIGARSSIAVESLHHPVRWNLDFFPVGVGEIRLKEVGAWIRFEAPDAIKINRGRAGVGQTQAWTQVASLKSLMRGCSSQVRNRGDFSVHADRHIDLEHAVVICLAGCLPVLSTSRAFDLHRSVRKRLGAESVGDYSKDVVQ